MKKHLWRVGLAATLALGLLIPSAAINPQEARAWQSLDKQWQRIDGTLWACVDSAFGDQQESRILDAMNIWNDISAGTIEILPLHYGTDCNANNFNYDIIIDRTQHSAVGGTISYTSGNTIGWDGVTRARIYWAYIKLDSDWVTDSYWGSGTQSCVVGQAGNGCKPDGKTAVTHELGHALGFDHSLGGSCSPGFNSSNYSAACTGNKLKIMSSGQADCDGHGSAGYEFSWCGWSPATQGYRHNTVGGDIENGMHDMYGP